MRDTLLVDLAGFGGFEGLHRRRNYLQSSTVGGKAMWTIITIVLDAILVGAAVALWAAHRSIKSYLSGYGQEKGKNLATHEDIEQILQDLRATTKTTEEIKTQVSSEKWNRQRQWEMRRDVLFSLAKRLAAVDDALLSYNSVVKASSRSEEQIARLPEEEIMRLNSAVNSGQERWMGAVQAFDECRLLAQLVCGKELVDALHQLAVVMNKIIVEGVDKGNWEVYDHCAIELARSLASVNAAMRNEMGIVPMAPFPKPQSSESSATQAPAPPAR